MRPRTEQNRRGCEGLAGPSSSYYALELKHRKVTKRKSYIHDLETDNYRNQKFERQGGGHQQRRVKREDALNSLGVPEGGRRGMRHLSTHGSKTYLQII